MKRLLRTCVFAVTLGTLSPSFAAPPTLDEGSTQGFAQALKPRAFEFPADHGAHPNFRHEWWYVTGNLDGPAGERFGFELTFFRVALKPESGVTTNTSASAWRTRQVYMAHFALTDVSRKDFWSTERYARDALGLAGAQASPFHVWLEDWSLEEHGSAWRLHAAEAEHSLTLDLVPQTPPVPNGENGLSRKASTLGAASYYYSIPRMSAQGQLKSGGQQFKVSGLAWLDREWGSGALGVEAQGWDWFALQLDDGSSLMFYALRNRDGSLDVNSAGTWVEQSRVAQPLQRQDVIIRPQNYWESPRGGRYPSRWKIQVTTLGLNLDVTPVLPNQELGTNPRYWEGAVDVTGTRSGKQITGRGYVELVGYATSRKP
jgi:predicted secreted hydrolase